MQVQTSTRAVAAAIGQQPEVSLAMKVLILGWCAAKFPSELTYDAHLVAQTKSKYAVAGAVGPVDRRERAQCAAQLAAVRSKMALSGQLGVGVSVAYRTRSRRFGRVDVVGFNGSLRCLPASHDS